MENILKEIEKRKGKIRSNEILNFFDANSNVGKQKANKKSRMARQTVIKTLNDAVYLKRLVRHPVGDYDKEKKGIPVTYEIPEIRKEIKKHEDFWEKYIAETIEDIDHYIGYIKKLHNLKSNEFGEILDKAVWTIRILWTIHRSLTFTFGDTEKWKDLEREIFKRQSILQNENIKAQKKFKNFGKQMVDRDIDKLMISLGELHELLKRSKTQ